MVKDEGTIQEIERLFPEEWVLVEETAWDEMNMPVRGQVLAHSPERDALTRQVRQIVRQRPGVKLFSFYTGEKIAEDVAPVL